VVDLHNALVILLTEILVMTKRNQTLSNIYLTFIGTKLEYVCDVWDGSFEREISKLEMV
jgi:hypothetical protein